jgi:thiosulfate/3-mercaptopyruvate sulfurtransferase
MRLYTGCVFAFLLLVSVLASSSAIRAAEPSVPEDRLVDAQWVRQHLDNPDVRVVDVSRRPADYRDGHIPGALFVDWKRDLIDRQRAKYYQVLSRPAFESLMGDLGAEPDTLLVFYDNWNNRLAVRALWTAAYYGHDRCAVLEGGIYSWMDAGYETSRETPVVETTSYRVATEHRDMVVDKNPLLKILCSGEAAVVDSRPARVYTGESPGTVVHTGDTVARRGHLPGAENVFWKSSLRDEDHFSDRKELRSLFREHGLDAESPVVFYCNEGLHASFNWFVATQILSFDQVRVYDGSAVEWAEDQMLPMVTGIECRHR